MRLHSAVSRRRSNHDGHLPGSFSFVPCFGRHPRTRRQGSMDLPLISRPGRGPHHIGCAYAYPYGYTYLPYLGTIVYATYCTIVVHYVCLAHLLRTCIYAKIEHSKIYGEQCIRDRPIQGRHGVASLLRIVYLLLGSMYGVCRVLARPRLS